MPTSVFEIDGVYVGGKTKQVNKIEEQVDRCKINYPNKRVAISLRQRADVGNEVVGVVKTKIFVLNRKYF